MSNIDVDRNDFGGTVILRKHTNYTVVNVQPMLFDPMTPIVVAFDEYTKYTTLTVEEASALREALTTALQYMGEQNIGEEIG